MPTQRCCATARSGDRCPGVFSYGFEDRTHGDVHPCPLCRVGNRWDARREEWSVHADPLGDEGKAEIA